MNATLDPPIKANSPKAGVAGQTRTRQPTRSILKVRHTQPSSSNDPAVHRSPCMLGLLRRHYNHMAQQEVSQVRPAQRGNHASYAKYGTAACTRNPGGPHTAPVTLCPRPFPRRYNRMAQLEISPIACAPAESHLGGSLFATLLYEWHPQQPLYYKY